MIKLLSKLGTSTGLLTGTFLVNFSSNNIPATSNIPKPQEIKQGVETITTLEEIEIYEKENNCSFAFVGSWSSKKVWKVKEFLKSHKIEEWKDRIIRGADEFKEKCKLNRSIALFWGSSNQKFGPDPDKFKS